MRKAQKEYFRTKSGRALNESKRLENEIDAEIEREELLRWRAPEKELPEEYTPVLVRYGHIETRKAVVWLMVTTEGRRVWNVDN